MSGKPKEPLTTEQEKQITTLGASGWSVNKISKRIGKSRTCVRNHLAKPDVQNAVRDEKAELAVIYRDKARDVVVSIGTEDINKASLQQKAVSSGILLDKSLLLAGEPTSIVDVRILMDIAGMIRRDQDQADAEYQRKWDEAHTLPAPQAQRTITLPPVPQPDTLASRPTSQPQTKTPRPAISVTPVTPAPQTQQPAPATVPRVRYYSVPANRHPDHDPPESPLTHGLFTPPK